MSKQKKNKKTKQQKKPIEVKERTKQSSLKPQKLNTAESFRVHKGSGLRTRDEFLKDGEPKERYKDKPKEFYRVLYVVDINEFNEFAVVENTTQKGRGLKSLPSEKFREFIYVEDNENKPIKVGEKFVRDASRDITDEDVTYILHRCHFYPDTKEKLEKLHSRDKKRPRK